MITIVEIRYRNYNHYNIYRSCLLTCGIAIVRLRSLVFLDDFEGNANIFVTIESSVTVFHGSKEHKILHELWKMLLSLTFSVRNLTDVILPCSQKLPSADYYRDA